MDAAAVLVGRWVGRTNAATPMTARSGRLLIIRGVRPAGAIWKADAPYGSADDHLEPVDVSVTWSVET
jgi:hypothetical protein